MIFLFWVGYGFVRRAYTHSDIHKPPEIFEVLAVPKQCGDVKLLFPGGYVWVGNMGNMMTAAMMSCEQGYEDANYGRRRRRRRYIYIDVPCRRRGLVFA